MSNSFSNADIPVLTALTDDQVADYLRRNPDFLASNPSLLADMNLPHDTRGNAISLIERQVSVLRDRNFDMRHRLNKLLDNARVNDALFDKTKSLVLGLLDTQNWNALINSVFYHLEIGFSIEKASVVLLDNAKPWPETQNKHLRIHSQSEFMAAAGDLLSPPRAACGQFDNDFLHLLFGKKADQVNSAAFAPLIHSNTLLGVLAVGHHDENYYRSSMNTMFLSFIAETLSRLLPVYIQRG